MNGPSIPESPRVSPEEEAQLRGVSKQFEAVFIDQMVSAMRKTVQSGGLIPEGSAEKTYRAMLDSEYSGTLAESGQIGLSQMIYEHLLRASGR